MKRCGKKMPESAANIAACGEQRRGRQESDPSAERYRGRGKVMKEKQRSVTEPTGVEVMA